MIWYQVRGQITYTRTQYCSCEFCEGHAENGHLQVDQVLRADDHIEAEVIAANAALDTATNTARSRTEIKDWDWDRGPSTILLPEDKFLRLIEAPELLHKEPTQ